MGQIKTFPTTESESVLYATNQQSNVLSKLDDIIA